MKFLTCRDYVCRFCAFGIIVVVVIDRELSQEAKPLYRGQKIIRRLSYLAVGQRKEIMRDILPNEAVSLRVISYAYTREYEQRGRH